MWKKDKREYYKLVEFVIVLSSIKLAVEVLGRRMWY